MQTGEGNVDFTNDGPDIISDYLLGYKFVFLGKATFSIDTDVSRKLPGGQMTGVLSVSIKLKVDPID